MIIRYWPFELNQSAAGDIDLCQFSWAPRPRPSVSVPQAPTRKLTSLVRLSISAAPALAGQVSAATQGVPPSIVHLQLPGHCIGARSERSCGYQSHAADHSRPADRKIAPHSRTDSLHQRQVVFSTDRFEAVTLCATGRCLDCGTKRHFAVVTAMTAFGRCQKWPFHPANKP